MRGGAGSQRPKLNWCYGTFPHCSSHKRVSINTKTEEAGHVHSQRAACILHNKSNSIPLEVTMGEKHTESMLAAGHENKPL